MRLRGRDEVRFREDRDPLVPAHVLARQRIEGQDLVYFVAKQADAQADVFVGRIELDDVAPHAEGAARKVVVVALVLNLDEPPQDLIAGDLLALLERHQQAVVGLRRSQAVDARYAGHDDDVAAFEERPRGRQPEAVDLFVDDRLLLDVRIGGRHEGFRLVIVVVADEKLDGVAREESPELLIQLGGQGLVVHHDQRRAVHLGQHLRHRECLTRAGDAEQDLTLVPATQGFGELRNGARLIAAQLEVGFETEPFADSRDR